MMAKSHVDHSNRVVDRWVGAFDANSRAIGETVQDGVNLGRPEECPSAHANSVFIVSLSLWQE